LRLKYILIVFTELGSYIYHHLCYISLIRDVKMIQSHKVNFIYYGFEFRMHEYMICVSNMIYIQYINISWSLTIWFFYYLNGLDI